MLHIYQWKYAQLKPSACISLKICQDNNFYVNKGSEVFVLLCLLEMSISSAHVHNSRFTGDSLVITKFPLPWCISLVITKFPLPWCIAC